MYYWKFVLVFNSIYRKKTSGSPGRTY